MLITTLPSADKLSLVDRMYANQDVGGARYNVGIRTLYSPVEALTRMKSIADKYGKKLWVDLKGRQLRITKWGDSSYGDIELNHELEVDIPAKILFRGNFWSNVVGVKGNKIVVDPDPEHAIGAGQSVNILGNNLRIKGYLTDKDKQYIQIAKQLGIHDYMLSFVERESDLEEVRRIDPESKLILKIENITGLNYVAQNYSPSSGSNLMAARDDLFINIGENKFQMIPSLELILERDPDAIVASHILTSLCNGGLTMGDISDIKLLKDMGYKNFMFSDDLSHRHFDEAIKIWGQFKQLYNG